MKLNLLNPRRRRRILCEALAIVKSDAPVWGRWLLIAVLFLLAAGVAGSLDRWSGVIR